MPGSPRVLSPKRKATVRTTRAIGDAIRGLREKKGWRPSDLARHAGVSQGYLSRIEHGGQPPGRATLVRIAEALGESVTAILGV